MMNKPNGTFHYALPTKWVHNFSLSRNAGIFSLVAFLTKGLLQYECCIPHLVHVLGDGGGGGGGSGGDHTAYVSRRTSGVFISVQRFPIMSAAMYTYCQVVHERR